MQVERDGLSPPPTADSHPTARGYSAASDNEVHVRTEARRGGTRKGEAMADDETQIRALIELWARAVHDGDLGGVLADHSDDIVMFDVPPPSDGVRGI